MTEQLRQCAILPDHEGYPPTCAPALIQQLIREGFKMKVKIKKAAGPFCVRITFLTAAAWINRFSGCMNQISDEIRIRMAGNVLQNDLYGGVGSGRLTTFYPYSKLENSPDTENQDPVESVRMVHCRAKVWENIDIPLRRHLVDSPEGFEMPVVSTKKIYQSGINDRFRLIIRMIRNAPGPEHHSRVIRRDPSLSQYFPMYHPVCTAQ